MSRLILELNHWTTWSTLYLLGEWLIRIAMLLWIPNRRSPEAAKGWLLLIFFLPSLGLLLYWLIGRLAALVEAEEPPVRSSTADLQWTGVQPLGVGRQKGNRGNGNATPNSGQARGLATDFLN